MISILCLPRSPLQWQNRLFQRLLYRTVPPKAGLLFIAESHQLESSNNNIPAVDSASIDVSAASPAIKLFIVLHTAGRDIASEKCGDNKTAPLLAELSFFMAGFSKHT